MTMTNPYDKDPTENIRKVMTVAINSQEAERAKLEAEHGKVWNTDELRAEFEVTGSWLLSL